MSRYTGPTTRINRRFGMAIFPRINHLSVVPILPVSTDQTSAEKQVITVQGY